MYKNNSQFLAYFAVIFCACFLSFATAQSLDTVIEAEIEETLEAPSLDEVLQDDLGQRLQAFQGQLGSGRGHVETDVIIYDCKYVQAATLRRVLEEFITSEGMVSESAESDQLVVSDRKDNIDTLKRIIERLDMPVPQILVEARIVELSMDSDFEKEVDLFYQDTGRPSASDGTAPGQIGSLLQVAGAAATTGQGGIFDTQVWEDGDQSLSVFLRYLETNGKAKILSAPNLIIQRGKEGSIVTGEEVPILSQTTSSGGVTTSTEFKSVGIKLSVKPTMISGDRVRIEVNPEVSTVTDFIDTGDVSNPIIAVRQARTELEVRDGQLISMAGLLQSTDLDTKRRTPILSEIPYLGTLFKSDRQQSRQTQLIIFLSINILDFGDETIVKPDNLDPRIEQTIEEIEDRNKEEVPAPSIYRDVTNLLDIETGE